MTGWRSAAQRLKAGTRLLGLLAVLPATLAAQGNDTSFDPSVACPAYASGVGPRLLIDEAHQNLHTAGGRYASFAAVAAHDGFRVEPSTATFRDAPPPEGSILVIANSRGANDPAESAFAPEEIARLRAWVEAGGSLLLIADHKPFGTAARALAASFGIEMSDGHVRDEKHAARELPGPYFLEFTRENGLLGDHAILRGRGPHETISRVVTFGGQALKTGQSLATLLRLGPAAEAVAEPDQANSPLEAVGGWSQAVALEVGKGRLVVVGEAGMFGAQFIEGEAARRAGLPGELRFGMNHPGTDDRQFLLNTLHWLARVL